VRCLRLARRAKIIDASRHHLDADDIFQALIESEADDDVGVLIDLFANAGRGFVDHWHKRRPVLFPSLARHREAQGNPVPPLSRCREEVTPGGNFGKAGIV